MGEMAHDAGHDAGGMEITSQRETFSGFLHATVWTSALVAQWVALLTLAFAIGAGWWAGLGAYLAIGVAVGVVFKMPAAWWAVLIAAIVLLGLGGVIVPVIVSMAG